MNVIYVLLGIFTLLRLVIGVQLLFNANRNNLPNLYWLSALFLVNFISLLFLPTQSNPLGWLSLGLWIGNGYALLTGLALIAFIRTTFYVNRPSPHRWFIGIHLAISAIAFYGITVSESYANPNPLVAGFYISATILWAWHAVISYQALVVIQGDENVEDWVKGRYQWMIGYAVIAAVGSLINAIRVALTGNFPSLVAILGLPALLANIFTVIPQFLVWSMPEGFRKWLNRNQQVHAEEQIHQRALSILNIIGSAMSDGTGITKLISIYSIRKIIGVGLNVEDQGKIEAHAITLGYDAWLKLIENPELYILIKNSTASNPRSAIEKAKQALIENQSLFTMQAR
jgi:hypothetical protein